MRRSSFSTCPVQQSTGPSNRAWDDKGYWQKAEGLREKWRWTRTAADKLTKLIVQDKWEDVPITMIELAPQFQSISVTNITRDADWWVGAHRALVKQAKVAARS